MSDKLRTWSNLKNPVFEYQDCYTCKHNYDINGPVPVRCVPCGLLNGVDDNAHPDNAWEWNGYSDAPDLDF